MAETRKEPKRGKTKAMGDVLPLLIEKISKKVGGMLPVIILRWEETVGEQVARHTTPTALRGKKLTVEVDDSVWMAELARFHKRRILDSVNHRLEGAIVDEIIFRPKRKS